MIRNFLATEFYRQTALRFVYFLLDFFQREESCPSVLNIFIRLGSNGDVYFSKNTGCVTKLRTTLSLIFSELVDITKNIFSTKVISAMFYICKLILVYLLAILYIIMEFLSIFDLPEKNAVHMSNFIHIIVCHFKGLRNFKIKIFSQCLVFIGYIFY